MLNRTPVHEIPDSPERSGLLDRAVHAILELRVESGIHRAGPGGDRLSEISAALRSVTLNSDTEIKQYLLTAAGMVRD
jgi:hypothetical protein